MKTWIPARIQAVRGLIEAEGVVCPAACAEGATTPCEYRGASSVRSCANGTWSTCVNPTPSGGGGAGGSADSPDGGAGGAGGGVEPDLPDGTDGGEWVPEPPMRRGGGCSATAVSNGGASGPVTAALAVLGATLAARVRGRRRR